MNEQGKKKAKLLLWIALHAMLAIYSLSSACAKLAGNEETFSFRFFMYYGFMLVLLAIYAIGWQQIIKRMPLTAAYANKAVSVIWACIFGILFFDEKITAGKIIGGLLTIAGVVLLAVADADMAGKNSKKPASAGKMTATVNETEANKITGDTNEIKKEGEA